MNKLNLCQYSDIFGKPNTGNHSYRIFDIAVVDVVATIIGALILSWIFRIGGFFCWLVILFLLGIILHRLFCVKTTVDKWLFGN